MLKIDIKQSGLLTVCMLAVMALPAFGQESILDLGKQNPGTGIPGTGPLTNAQIKEWLSQEGNHKPLTVKLPLGLSLGESQMKGLDKNPLTLAKIELGRQLYFDTRVSSDRTISCASCHHPQEGYSRHTPTGVGVNGQKGGRNSPVSYNRILSDAQFWDGRASSLEDQAVGPIQNAIEMGNTHEVMVRTLKGIEGYSMQFEKIFPGSGFTIDNVGKALAAFERTLVTGPAPFDYSEAYKRFATLDPEDLEELKTDSPETYTQYEEAKVLAEANPMSESALRGQELFFSKGVGCSNCHVGANLADGLHRVRMQANATLAAHRRNLGDRLDHARVVIRVDHAHQPRFRAESGGDRFGSDQSAAVAPHHGDFVAPMRHPSRGLANRRMLDGGNYQMASRGGWLVMHQPLQREIIALGAAGGENDLLRPAAQQGCHLAARIFDRFMASPAQRMRAGGMAIMLAQEREHRLLNARRDRSGGVVVEVERAHIAILWRRILDVHKARPTVGLASQPVQAKRGRPGKAVLRSACRAESRRDWPTICLRFELGFGFWFDVERLDRFGQIDELANEGVANGAEAADDPDHEHGDQEDPLQGEHAPALVAANSEELCEPSHRCGSWGKFLAADASAGCGVSKMHSPCQVPHRLGKGPPRSLNSWIFSDLRRSPAQSLSPSRHKECGFRNTCAAPCCEGETCFAGESTADRAESLHATGFCPCCPNDSRSSGQQHHNPPREQVTSRATLPAAVRTQIVQGFSPLLTRRVGMSLGRSRRRVPLAIASAAPIIRAPAANSITTRRVSKGPHVRPYPGP